MLNRYIADPLAITLKNLKCERVNERPGKLVFITDPWTGLVPFNLLSVDGSCIQSTFNITYFPSLAILELTRRRLAANVQPSLIPRQPNTSSLKAISRPLVLANGSDPFCITGCRPPASFITAKGETTLIRPCRSQINEAEKIANLLGVQSVSGHTETTDMCLKKIKKATIVHLATPGSSSTGKMRLAATGSDIPKPDNDGAFISSGNIIPQDLSQTRFVTLSSCDVHCPRITAEGVQGIESAFQIASPEATIISSNLSSPCATRVQLMPLIYQLMLTPKAHGQPATSLEAMQAAIWMLRQNPEFRHDFHWAGLQHFGPELMLLPDSADNSTIPVMSNTRAENLEKQVSQLHINHPDSHSFRFNLLMSSAEGPTGSFEWSHSIFSSDKFKKRAQDTHPQGFSVLWLPATNYFAVQAILHHSDIAVSGDICGDSAAGHPATFIIADMGSSRLAFSDFLDLHPGLLQLATCKRNTLIISDHDKTNIQTFTTHIKQLKNKLNTRFNVITEEAESPHSDMLNGLTDLFHHGLLDFSVSPDSHLFYKLALCTANSYSQRQWLDCSLRTAGLNQGHPIPTEATRAALSISEKAAGKFRSAGTDLDQLITKQPHRTHTLPKGIFADALLDYVLDVSTLNQLISPSVLENLLMAFSCFGQTPVHQELLQLIIKNVSSVSAPPFMDMLIASGLIRRHPCSTSKPEQGVAAENFYYMPTIVCEALNRRHAKAQDIKTKSVVLDAIEQWLVIRGQAGQVISRTDTLWFLAMLNPFHSDLEAACTANFPQNTDALHSLLTEAKQHSFQ